MEFKDGTELGDELDRASLQELGDDISPTLVDHVLRPRNDGMMEAADGEATLTGICGDTVRIQFRLKGDWIGDIRFMTNGCAATVGCASMATEWARGRRLPEVMRLNGREVIDALGGLPGEYTHCADLAANTLRAAVKDALEKRRAPWKRLYRPGGGP